VTAPQNVVLISIPSVADPSWAPSGKHVLHAYYPATEPWSLWDGLDRRSPEYKVLKNARSKPLWEAVSRIIPDIEKRVEIEMVGTPLTHARFLRRHHGSYGPAWKAGSDTFPFGNTPIPGLFCCGDFTFPGIGKEEFSPVKLFLETVLLYRLLYLHFLCRVTCRSGIGCHYREYLGSITETHRIVASN
jgi:phytoene dehydrogenase-like protein